MIVKLSTPWNLNYEQQLVVLENNEDVIFEINNACNSCDVWIIWGGLNKPEQVTVAPHNIIYIADECYEERSYNKEFLSQFNKIASVGSNIGIDNKINIHELTIWYFKNSIDILNLEPINKTNKISLVASDLTYIKGHKKRFAFVNKLIGHFKDRIDFYGRGINEIEDKFSAIAPYQFSICIENNVVPNYFTEKIAECFLTYTVPIYYGCPNIDDYFSDSSIIRINIEDYRSAINVIESVIDSDCYESYLPKIVEARNLYLKKYHLFPALKKIIRQHTQLNSRKEKVTVLPEYYFEKKIPEKLENITTKQLFNELVKRVINKTSYR